MPFDVPFAQWMFARKTFNLGKHDPSDAISQSQQNAILKALRAKDHKEELHLTEKQKQSMLGAFDKLYNYFREKKPIRSTKMSKGKKYFEREIYWKSRYPKKGTERHKLKENCGSKCFLLPEEEAFPVCPVCKEDVCTCDGDCAGLLSAYRRARQLVSRFPEKAAKYEAVAKEARKRAVKKNCQWTKK